MTGLPCGGLEIDWDFDPPKMGDELVKAKIGDGLKLPAWKGKPPVLIRTSHIADYFIGKGKHLPENGGDEHNARLWLWWFLGATYLGEKGERVSTSTLYYLFDFNRIGDYDWVSPSLSLTMKYLRDAIRPDTMDKGSDSSLVFPGILMESWVFSHFPSLLPPGFVSPSNYPAVHGWATCDRRRMSWTYDSARCLLNEMTVDKFVARPWDGYTGIPAGLLERMRIKDGLRLYLHSLYGSFWYLGERLVRQISWDHFVVPVDPPACLFVQTKNPAVRRQFGEGLGEELLLQDEDYGAFAQSRLACGPIEVYDPDMEHQPPYFPTSVEFEYLGERRSLQLPETSTMVADHGMESWVDKVRKVGGQIHKRIWRTANRWKDLASRQAAELCQNRGDVVEARAETAALRAEFDAYK